MNTLGLLWLGLIVAAAADYCGNGIVETGSGEECDDDNFDSGA